ncbi:MAG: crossover junction endodeoxyribonuclease RuvC [Deltaproteobacteria bacterium]|nr:crossover junction endodeoxyribonuclease RuvC [Deltaproteobacteria bacterium]
MRVLGIDPGSIATGYGVVEKKGSGPLSCVSAGVISAGAKTEFSKRLLKIHDGINAVIGEFSPDCVSVESLFYSKNARSAALLGHARGVVLLCAARVGLPVYEYPPRQVKLAVTGYGGAGKTQVQDMARAILKTKEKWPLDASDALAAAICHIHLLRPGMGHLLKQPSKLRSWRDVKL